MRPILFPLIPFAFLTIWQTPHAFGWAEHVRVTQPAVEKLEGLSTVQFRTIDEALAKGLANFKAHKASELAAELKIRREYLFPPRFAEVKGSKIPARFVLARYSDEPDWGVDQELFGTDQYPELWNDDLKYVTLKTGPNSQGYRHLFFPGRWQITHPIESLQIPMRPLGEAPKRAELFRKLAADFFERGEAYWGYRFLAWSLHYIEDLHQPFHARQTPNKSLIVLKWKNLLPSIDVPATAQQIVYYHTSYEQFIAEQMQNKRGPLYDSLAKPTRMSAPGTDWETYFATTMTDFGAAHAYRVGSLARRLFKPFHPAPGETAEQVVGTDGWRDAIRDNDTAAELIGVTQKLFEHLGEVVREVISVTVPKTKT